MLHDRDTLIQSVRNDSDVISLPIGTPVIYTGKYTGDEYVGIIAEIK